MCICIHVFPHQRGWKNPAAPAFKVARSWVCALEHIGSAAEISRCGVMPCHWCRTTIRTGAVALAARSCHAMEDLFLHWELFVYCRTNLFSFHFLIGEIQSGLEAMLKRVVSNLLSFCRSWPVMICDDGAAWPIFPAIKSTRGVPNRW